KELFRECRGTGLLSNGRDTVSRSPEILAVRPPRRNSGVFLNEAAASFFFPRQNALGKHVRSTEPNAARATCEVIAVVADAKYLSLREPAPPTIYYPYEQLPSSNWVGFITRSHHTSAAVAAFTNALSRLAPDTPLLPPITMQRQL